MEFLKDFYQLYKKHTLRIAFSAFGIFWGVFMIILLLSSGKGLENGVQNRYKGIEINSFHLYPGRTEKAALGLPEGREITFTNSDLEALQQQVGVIRYSSARTFADNLITIRYQQATTTASLYGVQADYNSIRPSAIQKGRFINRSDEVGKRRVILLGKTIYEELLITREAVGLDILVNNLPFTIIGVFESLRDGEQGNRENNSVFIPTSTFQQSFGEGNKIKSISFVPANPDSLLILQLNAMQLLRQRKHIASTDKKAITVVSTQEEYDKFQSLFNGIRIFLWVVGIGTLLSGIISVSNIMLVSVNERSKEIAIRKAIGANPAQIVKSIVLESLTLTLTAGYAGLSAGLILVTGVDSFMKKAGINNEFFKEPQVPGAVVIAILLIIVAAGMVAGYIPARRAAFIPPASALKED
jgi:putative ABC transport system permease protein